MNKFKQKSETTSASGVKKVVSVSEITLDKLGVSGEFQKPGTITAQIRQIVRTESSYPEKKVTSNLQANFFATEDYGFGSKDYSNDENRVAFLLVPENATEAIIIAKLQTANAAGGCIYRVLSNSPILDDNQKYAISAALRTVNQFANSQVVRYPKTAENDLKGLSGKIWTDAAGNIQYRRTFYWNTPQEDVDLRDASKPVYMSPEIAAELKGAGVLKGQTLV